MEALLHALLTSVPGGGEGSVSRLSHLRSGELKVEVKNHRGIQGKWRHCSTSTVGGGGRLVTLSGRFGPSERATGYQINEMLTGPQGLSGYFEEQCAVNIYAIIVGRAPPHPPLPSCPVSPQFRAQTACWPQGDGDNMKMKHNLRHFWYFSALPHDFIQSKVYFKNCIHVFMRIIH